MITAMRAAARSLSPAELRLTVAALVDAFGTGCFLAGLAVFFTRKLGLTPDLVGLGLTWSGVLGLATTVRWGRAADRWGARRVLVLLLCARALAFTLYAFAGSYAAFLAVTTLLGLVDKAGAPIQQALVGEVVGEERRQRSLALMRSTRNVGFALGALAAAGAVASATELGDTGIVLINAASFLFAAVLMGTLPGVARSARVGVATRRGLVRDRRYLAVTGLNGVLTIHMSLLSAGLPLWLLGRTSAPAATIPLLMVVNAVLAVLLQVPAATLVRSRRGAARSLAVAGVALAATCAAMPLAAALGGGAVVAAAVAAVLALTIAELAQAAGGWDLSFRLAPDDRRGQYLGVFSLGQTAQTMVGPLLLTTVVFAVGPWGWLGLGAVTTVAGLVAPAVAGAERAQRRAAEPGPALALDG